MPAKAGGSYFFRFSICPDWITGGLGSVISQTWGFFSSSFMVFTSKEVCAAADRIYEEKRHRFLCAAWDY